MLPGYNHNIRYKEKVFHVQTEDNGLDDPDLVTQVFLGGQIVAIERSSYGDVLVDQLEERDRDDRIKNLMQEQHKKLLKSLIRGEYDPKIETFLRAQALRNDVAAMENPSHEPNFEALDAAILAAEQNPITPESLLAPDAVLELSTSELFAQEPRAVSLSDTDPRPKPPVPSTTPPQPFLVEDLKVALRRPEGRPDSDRFDNNDDAMLGMIEQQMHQQLTWSPSKETKPADPSLAQTIPQDISSAATLEEPVNSSAISHIQRARELAKNAESAARRDEFASHVDTRRIPMEDARRTSGSIGVDEMPTKIGRRKPSNPKGEPHRDLTPTNDLQTKDMHGKVPDTLVDYGLPAALRREIDEEIARRATTPVPEQAPAPQKNDQRAFFRPSAPKPEGRYSSVRKPPVDRPFDAASTPVDSNLDKIPKKGGGQERFPSQPDTMIEVDRAKVDAEAARLRNATPRRASRPAPPDPKASPPSTPPRKIIEKNSPSAQHGKDGGEDPKRPSILVVERSLDEVILSYLYDEMAEK